MGKDVTSDSKVQQPTPPRTSLKGGTHTVASRAVGWVGDGTTSTMVGIESWAAYAVDGQKVRVIYGVQLGRQRSWCIAGEG